MSKYSETFITREDVLDVFRHQLRVMEGVLQHYIKKDDISLRDYAYERFSDDAFILDDMLAYMDIDYRHPLRRMATKLKKCKEYYK